MKEQIVFAGSDWFGAELGDSFFARLLSFLQPGKVFDKFVADGFRAGKTAARLKIASAAIDGGDCEKRQRADDVMLDARAFGRSVKLLLVLKRKARSYKARPFSLQSRFVQ